MELQLGVAPCQTDRDDKAFIDTDIGKPSSASKSHCETREDDIFYVQRIQATHFFSKFCKNFRFNESPHVLLTVVVWISFVLNGPHDGIPVPNAAVLSWWGEETSGDY